MITLPIMLSYSLSETFSLHYIVLTCGYVFAPLLDYDLRAESVLTHLFGYHRASNGICAQNIFSKLMKIQSAKSCQCPNYSY